MLRFLTLVVLFSWTILVQAQSNQPSTSGNIPQMNNDCSLQENLVDEFSGKRKRALQARWFFSFTPEAYQKFFTEDDFLHCQGYLAEREGQLSLQLIINIQDQTAKQSFGTLLPQSKIIIYPMRGNSIPLQTYKGAELIETADQTTYKCSYPISKKQLKALKKVEIDQIRINWSQGFQTYEVYYLDFLLDQFACLENL